ncbi:hypothetical protein [Paenibacillus phytorum]|uniref:hypothetical protein n=1 Tax=Paenibacillus phytorum TaxID=2654977 RepID=UPI001490D2E4|nr:hypothetical protein [Paenibacillus phytorum]
MKPIMKLFFPHPSKGASLLYDAAVGGKNEASGVFLVKSQVTELKFTDQGRKVLDKASDIYEREFTLQH